MLVPIILFAAVKTYDCENAQKSVAVLSFHQLAHVIGILSLLFHFLFLVALLLC